LLARVPFQAMFGPRWNEEACSSANKHGLLSSQRMRWWGKIQKSEVAHSLCESDNRLKKGGSWGSSVRLARMEGEGLLFRA